MFAIAEPPPGGPNSEGWFASVTRASGAVRDGGLGRSRGRDVVEDPVAAVALDDRVVAPHFLEHLRAQTNVTRRAQAVAGGGADGDALPRFGHLLEHAEQLLIGLGHQLGSRGARL